MLTRGLVREQVTETLTEADAALNTIWRNEADGRAVLLRITPAGLEAIGVEREGGQDDAGTDAADTGPAGEPAVTGPSGATEAAGGSGSPNDAGEPEQASAGHTAPRERKTREGTKQVALVAMLQRPEGTTIAQVVEATGWQPHTVRGALAGALKRRLGLTITSEKVEGGDRVYRVQP